MRQETPDLIMMRRGDSSGERSRVSADSAQQSGKGMGGQASMSVRDAQPSLRELRHHDTAPLAQRELKEQEDLDLWALLNVEQRKGPELEWEDGPFEEEDEVQDAFMATFRDAGGKRTHDTHVGKEVLQDAPRCILADAVVTAEDVTSVSKGALQGLFVVELKRREIRNGEYGHLFNRAETKAEVQDQLAAWLSMTPAFQREQVFCLLTDLQKAVVYRATRALEVGQDPVLAHTAVLDAAEVLPIMYSLSAEELGIQNPRVTVHAGDDEGHRSVTLTDYLGYGATAHVYNCTIDGDEGQFVAKLLHDNVELQVDKEIGVLDALTTAGVRVQVPVGRLYIQDGPEDSFVLRGIVFRHAGDCILNHARDLSTAQVRTLVRGVFDQLRGAWNHGYVHRDLRPDNILVHNVDHYNDSIGAATLIDWAECIEPGREATQVRGGVSFASSNLLRRLGRTMSGGPPSYLFKYHYTILDDAESFCRLVMAMTLRLSTKEIERLQDACAAYGYLRIDRFWTRKLPPIFNRRLEELRAMSPEDRAGVIGWVEQFMLDAC